MAFDRISEEIAHFIGMFHLEVEGHRLRLEYEAFSFQRSAEARVFPAPPDLKLSAPFALKGYDPGLAYLRPPSEPVPLPLKPAPVELGGITMAVSSGPLPPPPSLSPPDSHAAATFGWTTDGGFLPPPSSILIAISQTAALADNDLLLFTGETAFIDPAQLTAEFRELIAAAQALAAPAIEGEGVVPRLEAMLDLAAAIAAFAPEDAPADVQLFLRGEGLQGTYLDGLELLPAPDGAEETAPAAQLPAFKDLLPAHLAAKRPDPEAEDDPGKDPFTLPRDPTPAPGIELPDIDPGHKIVTGGNLSVNEVGISQAWVDAPVIAVAGDAIRLDSIAQVNLRKEAPPSALPSVEALPSTALNALQIEVESAPGPGPGPAGQFPHSWHVARVEGDLISVNWIQQHVFATDFDRAEITLSAAATYISTGENVVTNAAWLTEFGAQYDLMLIGGDMITLNQIHQINVLFDVDVIGGLPEAGVTVSTGGNLQYNLAEIKQTGRDEMVAVQASFQKALDAMAEGKREIAQEVLNDARFEGKTALKVLQVEGDLIKANIIEQKNYLGDSDQVQLMLDDFLAADEGIALITGSNAQLNAARLHDVGLDSEVMVAGTAYSDALIYQAQLLDPEAPPTGVALAPLASEAVAFLSEDMIGIERDLDPAGTVTAKAATTAPADHPANSDALYAIMT